MSYLMHTKILHINKFKMMSRLYILYIHVYYIGVETRGGGGGGGGQQRQLPPYHRVGGIYFRLPNFLLFTVHIYHCVCYHLNYKIFIFMICKRNIFSQPVKGFLKFCERFCADQNHTQFTLLLII